MKSFSGRESRIARESHVEQIHGWPWTVTRKIGMWNTAACKGNHYLLTANSWLPRLMSSEDTSQWRNVNCLPRVSSSSCFAKIVVKLSKTFIRKLCFPRYNLREKALKNCFKHLRSGRYRSKREKNKKIHRRKPRFSNRENDITVGTNFETKNLKIYIRRPRFNS